MCDAADRLGLWINGGELDELEPEGMEDRGGRDGGDLSGHPVIQPSDLRVSRDLASPSPPIIPRILLLSTPSDENTHHCAARVFSRWLCSLPH